MATGMFVDARAVPPGEGLKADICIVGAGAAGLAMIQKLAKTGLKVLLIESGGLRDTPAGQVLNKGTSNHADYPFTESRARAFGGTTVRWTGACMPLDRVDFEPRPWLAHSGWPISLGDLEQFDKEAASIFGIPSSQSLQAQLERSPFHGCDLESKTVFYSNPLNLGRKYRRLVRRSATVTCLLNGSVTELILDASGQRIECLEIRCLTGHRFTVRARATILATGGIENARLLLASNTTQSAGIGNRHDVVGRYHMEHPIKPVGILPIGTRCHDALLFTNRVRTGGAAARGTLGLSRECREREKLLDMHLRFYRYHRLEDGAPVIAAKELEVGRGHASGRGALASFWRTHRGNIATGALPYAAWHFWNKIYRRARFDRLRFTAFVEQEPDPENRVTLSREKDAFGKPLAHLHYHESNFMNDSILRTLELMRTAFRQQGFGELRYGPGNIAHLANYEKYGLHQLGSTRMADDPRHGVVDRDCRVHGIENLFIAGSSVFCTGGAANPTLTIAALSLRLADHLCNAIREMKPV